jgi:hypothetical protein
MPGIIVLVLTAVIVIAAVTVLSFAGGGRGRLRLVQGPSAPVPPLAGPAGEAGGIMTAQSMATRPVPGAGRAGPADPITLDESVTMAFLVILESMTPAQRVAVILHDVFRYSHAEVAEITGLTPAASLQLAYPARQAHLVGEFGRAWEARDVEALIGLLHPAATAVPNGADLVRAALCPIEGDEAIAHYLVDLVGTAPGLAIVERTVNGQPGLGVAQNGVTVAAFAFDVECDRIIRVWAARNPSGRHPDGRRTGSSPRSSALSLRRRTYRRNTLRAGRRDAGIPAMIGECVV